MMGADGWRVYDSQLIGCHALASTMDALFSPLNVQWYWYADLSGWLSTPGVTIGYVGNDAIMCVDISLVGIL